MIFTIKYLPQANNTYGGKLALDAIADMARVLNGDLPATAGSVSYLLENPIPLNEWLITNTVTTASATTLDFTLVSEGLTPLSVKLEGSGAVSASNYGATLKWIENGTAMITATTPTFTTASPITIVVVMTNDYFAVLYETFTGNLKPILSIFKRTRVVPLEENFRSTTPAIYNILTTMTHSQYEEGTALVATVLSSDSYTAPPLVSFAHTDNKLYFEAFDISAIAGIAWPFKNGRLATVAGIKTELLKFAFSDKVIIDGVPTVIAEYPGSYNIIFRGA